MKDTSSSGNTILQWQWQKVPNEKIKENTIDFIKKKNHDNIPSNLQTRL
jgi:hypothetical protein